MAMADSDARTERSPCIRAALYCPKGGIGKTTTTGHFGVAFARDGLDVLLIDLAGNQGDLAKQFGLYDDVLEWLESDDDWPNISTVFQPQWDSIVQKYREQMGTDVVEELIWETGEGPDLIPAHPGLDSLEVELDNKYDDARRFTRLEAFLDEHITPRYDVVLLDLPGAPNNVSYNGVFAAGHVVTPVQAGSFEARQAERLGETLARIREDHGRDTQLTMLIPNMVDTRTNLGEQYLGDYAQLFTSAIAPKPVPRSQDIANAQEAGTTIFALEEPSDTAQRAIDAYETDALELLVRCRQRDKSEDGIGGAVHDARF